MQKSNNNSTALNKTTQNNSNNKNKRFVFKSLIIYGDKALFTYCFRGKESELFIHILHLIPDSDKPDSITSFSVRGYSIGVNQFETVENDNKSKIFYLNKSQFDKESFKKLCEVFNDLSKNKDSIQGSCCESIIEFKKANGLIDKNNDLIKNNNLIENNCPKSINKSSSSSSNQVKKCVMCPKNSLDDVEFCSMSCALLVFGGNTSSSSSSSSSSNTVQNNASKSKQCWLCSNTTDESSNFCNACEKAQATALKNLSKKCKGCGNPHSKSEEFCSNDCIKKCEIVSEFQKKYRDACINYNNCKSWGINKPQYKYIYRCPNCPTQSYCTDGVNDVRNCEGCKSNSFERFNAYYCDGCYQSYNLQLEFNN